ncbi:unnamed protein product [Nippostrongylus brasiliensis]|uniref:Conserved domain protein n=1 Tax=Nippostrongylus brasiliensis TaxID=27835 RepID=A0A0N4YRZ3_NIPBR|nr:unnamed protein product [Nippostrongylus brasiliensis]
MSLNFLLQIGCYSDEARLFGIEFEDIHAIRINFISGEKGIEIAYAFSDHVTPGISDLMQLDVWDGQDVSKLTLNLVKAPYCQARLLNSQVYPFTFPSKIKTEDVMWATEVWLCFIDGLDRTKGVENAYDQFDFENACRDSLRFQTLEQVVYVYKNGQCQ